MKPTYTKEERQAYMREETRKAMESVLEMVRSGQVGDAIAHHLMDVSPDAPCREWSPTNRMLLYLNKTADARGYRQWAEVGRHVAKGAKAFHIFVPRFVRVEKADTETGEEKEEQKLIGFMLAPVFRYEDTEGEPLPEYQAGPVPDFAEAATAWNIAIEYGPSTQGEYGFFSVKGREVIHLSSQDPDTLWHELGHAAHKRLLASQGKSMKPGQDVEQEIVAEWVAATIGRIVGRPTGETAWAVRYMEAYAGSQERLLGSLAGLAAVAEDCVLLIMDAAASVATIAQTA